MRYLRRSIYFGISVGIKDLRKESYGMKDICVMPEGCVFRECELKGVVECYLSEECKVVSCPDKEKSYTNRANRGPEIDLLLESESGKRIAVEVKSIKLENKPFIRDINMILDTIS
jgi:hypothetical protein